MAGVADIKEVELSVDLKLKNIERTETARVEAQAKAATKSDKKESVMLIPQNFSANFRDHRFDVANRAASNSYVPGKGKGKGKGGAKGGGAKGGGGKGSGGGGSGGRSSDDMMCAPLHQYYVYRLSFAVLFTYCGRVGGAGSSGSSVKTCSSGGGEHISLWLGGLILRLRLFPRV